LSDFLEELSEEQRAELMVPDNILLKSGMLFGEWIATFAVITECGTDLMTLLQTLLSQILRGLAVLRKLMVDT